MQDAALQEEIIRCEACPSALVDRACLPISQFGTQAPTAWVVAINPSAREFYRRDNAPLMGVNKRFSWIGPTKRSSMTSKFVSTALDLQEQYFLRNPYKPYFNRLGRFLLSLHNTRPPLHDPLLPFKEGAFTSRKKAYVYAHLDTVKCATLRPWGRLDVRERAVLQENCKPFFVQQLQQAVGLELLVVNGRSAMDVVFPLISAHFQYEGQRHRTPLGGKTAELEHGSIRVAGRAVPVVGWSPNVVNQQLTTAEVSDLVDGIVSACPWLR